MPFLIIDTETSGLFDFRKPADAPGQPRLAAFSGFMLDVDLLQTDSLETLVKPNGWTISPEVSAINNLTIEQCEQNGRPIAEVLAWYTDQVKAGAVVVAYNAQYDTKVMRGEFRRLQLPDLFEETPNLCLMRAAHKLGIEKAGAKKGGFPKLSDTYRHLFDEELTDAHNSTSDALAALRIFRKMHGAGQLPEPEVHYAKNRPTTDEAAPPAA